MIASVLSSVRQPILDLALECQECYQCGQCTSACPNGWDMHRGPRLLMRLLLSGDVTQLLACEDVWRCSECQACTRACPMEIDIAGVLARLRMLELEHGAQRCPEREATRVAIRHLKRRRHVDNIVFGMTMAARGWLPKDMPGAAGAVVQAVGSRIRRPEGRRPVASRTTPESATLFAGCALRQDPENHRRTRDMASALGLNVVEADSAACCGHPTRGARAPAEGAASAYTVCPGCEASLHHAGITTRPLWEALAERALRDGRGLIAAGTAFVPYVGCLGDRNRALAALSDAATLSGASVHMAYPSLHAGCCGAIGSMYRGLTQATLRLLDFAEDRRAPIVTTCLLCRDNLRSAARQRRIGTLTYFWPEFFQAAPLTGSAPPPNGALR